jgi:hypothetical protein
MIPPPKTFTLSLSYHAKQIININFKKFVDETGYPFYNYLQDKQYTENVL